MKVMLPTFSFLYSYIEKWLSKMSSQGYHVTSIKGWIWTFEKDIPLNTEYFVWMQRPKGKDCSSLAGELSCFYGVNDQKHKIAKLEGIFIRITEIDISKINDHIYNYYLKRNYMVMTVSFWNFVCGLLFFLLPLLLKQFSYVLLIITIILGLNFILNYIQYKKRPKTGN